MIVHIPSPLRSYTDGKTPVEVGGRTLGALLKNLDLKYDGFLFRVIDEQGNIREHMRFFLGSTPVDNLKTSLNGVQEVHIICAISGG
ncbi:MAG: molybdopterin synthase sulfur carrier subunit [Planctomycetota bacterium]|jgi:molybdopterin synthase sulfur carrier subunit